MKRTIHIYLATMLLVFSACKTPRLVESIDDIGKLEIEKKAFIGYPLNKLLSEIKPKIKVVHGNPENRSGHVTGGTYLVFYFVSREVAKERIGRNDSPTHITINFQLEPDNTRKPLPKGGLTKWTKKESKEYGDMIILKFFISGKN